MKITSAEFVISVAGLAQLPKTGLPQIAFVGRSNVGKSTLLNTLLNRRRLAYISSTPGKTQTLNFYIINKEFYFVDLPGYGYARSAKTLRQSWQGLIEPFLLESADLKLIVLLVDLRHPFSDLDEQLLEWLEAHRLNFVVVATKADKLSGGEVKKNLALLRAGWPSASLEIIPFSATTGMGKEEVWRFLARAIRGQNNVPR